MRRTVIRLLLLGLLLLAGAGLFLWLGPRTEPPVLPGMGVRP
jgi:hypothetical protein